jgi:cation diffusion facilitator CzcD-associated flavoprotein CzcO
VIGAGAAGLVAARELYREGHRPVVFEQGNKVGGVWVYTDEVEEPVGTTGMYHHLQAQSAIAAARAGNALCNKALLWLTHVGCHN